MGSLNHSILRKFVCFFLGFSTYLSSLFGFMNKWMPRLKGEYLNLSIDPIIDSDSMSLENKEKPESFLSFRFQRYEEFIDGAKEFTNSKLEKVVDDQEVDSLNGSSSDDEFYDPCYDPTITDEDYDGSLCDDEEDETLIFSKATSLLVPEKGNDHCKDLDESFAVKEVKTFCGSLCDEDEPLVCSKATSLQVHDKEDPESEKGDDHCKDLDESFVVKEVKPFGDEDVDFELSSGSDSESVVSSSNFSLRSSLLDSIKDGYSSSSSSDDDNDDEDKIEMNMLKGELKKKLSSLEEAEFQELSKGYENDDVEEEDEELLAELKGIEEDVAKDKQANEDENSVEEENGMETQWEHQNLIEQLKMEIGKVKAIGLPTIFEDSEPPKMADDLKPWKIEEKLFRTSGTMDEVHKFYKSYRERMRKFDIFNYQKMYAIGFLRLKDPLQAFSPQKISLATIVSQDCWPCKPNKSSATSNYSVLKFTRELESDLETVYVGQLCLSWEFLHWEYGKALALWDSDPREIRRFNEVAGEFQQFQVLLQRFLEDEPFRSTGRAQNYVKDRCLHRRLLQVPVIREDSAKDKMKQRRNGSTDKDSVTSVIIIEMIEESMRLLWQLIRTDKDATTSKALNSQKASHAELQNPEDATLLLEVQETLRKKQKKLKELTRSECCILRKLQRNHTKQNYAGRVLCFFSQVDMKLVSRVLNMSRVTTDQLAWCGSKLDNIEFVDNRIRREPSFLLFPCS